MKKFIVVLCVLLVFLLVVWLVVRMNKNQSLQVGYHASERDEKITILDMDDLEHRAKIILRVAQKPKKQCVEIFWLLILLILFHVF